MRNCVHLLAKATATPVRVTGLENLPADGGPFVLVANHASYLDPYALTIALPGSFRFVAKGELAEHFFIRKPLEKIHTEFVDRFDVSKSVGASQHLGAVLKAGHKLMFFAEGTFTRIPGLAPFHLGAFSIAAEADAPVVPLSIRGTRSILRAENWFPRHGAIHINIGAPIHPREIRRQTGEDSWQIAVALRDRSRQFILRHCGEPDLA
jgi:1-acyl-sn-glycerol-3-phosphate acyltransferase